MGDAYALDDVPRTTTAGEKVQCHPEVLVLYRGDVVRLEPPSSVAEPFRERLQRFERAVSEIGVAVYGRAPSRIVHAGTYACREVAHREQRLSEHALGNAIDVTGFRFGALSKEATKTSVLPSKLRGPFLITITKDWHADPGASDVARKHREFFDRLAAVLREQQLFRGVLGPGDPNHQTHLHLDMAPWPHERL